MALHSVSKSPSRDNNIRPNTHDTLQDVTRTAHATTSVNPITDATSTKGFLQTQNSRLLANDGTVPRAIYGFNQALNQWGVFVTKPGVDVTTNTDNSQFIFNSSQDIFKIVSSGTATLNLNGSLPSQTPPVATTAIPHGLGIAPAAIIYFSMDTTALPGINVGQQYATPYATFGGTLRYSYRVDSSSLYFDFYNDSGSTFSSLGIATFKYYLLQETAN